MNSSGAMGQSTRRRAVATAARGRGDRPRTLTRSRGTTSSSASQGSSSLVESALDHVAQPAGAGGGRPRPPARPPAGVAGHRRRRPGPGHGDEGLGAHAGAFHQHQVGGGGRRAQPGQGHVGGLHVDCAAADAPGRSPRWPRRRPARRGHPGPAAPRPPARASPARRRWRRRAGRATARRAVRSASNSSTAAHASRMRVDGHAHPRRQPPQRARRGVAGQHPPTGHDHAGRIVAERSRASRPSPAPAPPGRPPRTGPRSGAVRSGAPAPTYRPLDAAAPGVGRSPWWARATVSGPWPPARFRHHAPLIALRRRDSHDRRVADHVPAAGRGARPVHLRELVAARDVGPHPAKRSEGASVRVCFILTCTEDEARQFLGPVDRAGARPTSTPIGPSCGPASSRSCRPSSTSARPARSRAWPRAGDPDEWRAIVATVAREKAWSRPMVPGPGDPAPYPGSPALAEPGSPAPAAS